MEEAHQQLQDQKDETLVNYDKVVRDSLKRSKAALDRAIEFRKNFDFGNLNHDKTAFSQYLRDVSEAKFGPRSPKGQLCWINPATLHDLFEKIETDPRVKFFFKDFAWIIIDVYGYARTFGDLLNYYFPINVNRKPANNIYRRFLLHQGLLKQRMPRNPEKLKIAIAENEKRREGFRDKLTALITPIPKESGIDIMAIIDAGVSGDLRKLEKVAFPILCQTILLNSEIEKGKIDEHLSMVRAVLLFDVLRLIAPTRHLMNKEEFKLKFESGKTGAYDGNYSRYQRDTLRTVIGL